MRFYVFTSILFTFFLTAGISASTPSGRPSYSDSYLTSGKMTPGTLLASDITDSDEEANVDDPDEEANVGDPDEEPMQAIWIKSEVLDTKISPNKYKGAENETA